MGDVVEHIQRPGARRRAERRHQRTGDFEPEPPRLFADRDFAPRVPPAGAHRLEVIQERHAVEDDLHPLADHVRGSGEDRGQRRIREADIVVGINDQHRLPQAAERGFEMGELVRSLGLQAEHLGHERADPVPQALPVAGRPPARLDWRPGPLGSQHDLAEFARRPPVAAQPQHRRHQRRTEHRDDQVTHASGRPSAIR